MKYELEKQKVSAVLLCNMQPSQKDNLYDELVHSTPHIDHFFYQSYRISC